VTSCEVICVRRHFGARRVLANLSCVSLSLGRVELGEPKRLVSGGLWFGLTFAMKKIGMTLGEENKNMLWTIFVILLILWALGLVTSYTMGGVIHLLLVLAVIVLVIRLVQGRSIA
jgi:hypothetical protein